MPTKHKFSHPQWALQHRRPGTELRNINGRYYLYSVSSRYDPVLKKSRKITGKILGAVTQKDGFIESDKRKLAAKASAGFDAGTLCIREYGFSDFLHQHGQSVMEKVRQYFPSHYMLVVYMAYCRLVHLSSMRNMPFHIAKSMLSVEDKNSYSDKTISMALREIGRMRTTITGYMKSFIAQNEYVLVDMTNMFSASQKMRYAQEGYNSEMKFDRQFNLMYLYSSRLAQPVFYSLFAGNIREVKSFKFCLQESGLQDAVVIADKGFYSKKNIEALQQEQLHYIIPLRRDNLLVEYGRLNRTQINYFSFEQRYIWYTSYVTGGREIYLFKDEKLKVQEEKDYLDRIESLPEYYNLPAFHKKTTVFGTIAMLSNIKDRDPASIFAIYKSRNNVELMFDGLKNVLNADRTYMQNEEALQGWMFVNHIALQWYYILYSLLKEHKLLKHYSVRDFIIHLYELKKIKINDNWIKEPTTKKTETLLEKLKISIT